MSLVERPWLLVQLFVRALLPSPLSTPPQRVQPSGKASKDKYVSESNKAQRLRTNELSTNKNGCTPHKAAFGKMGAERFWMEPSLVGVGVGAVQDNRKIWYWFLVVVLTDWASASPPEGIARSSRANAGAPDAKVAKAAPIEATAKALRED